MNQIKRKAVDRMDYEADAVTQLARIRSSREPAQKLIQVTDDWPRQRSEFEEMWLLGLPPLPRYLSFIEQDGAKGEAADRARLVDEWRMANDYYLALERHEAGIANQD